MSESTGFVPYFTGLQYDNVILHGFVDDPNIAINSQFSYGGILEPQFLTMPRYIFVELVMAVVIFWSHVPVP